MRDLIIKQCHESLGYMVIFRRDILDSEREVVSTACDRNVHELSMAEKGMSRRTVHTSLPKDRLITYKPPFMYVGIDYFRPLKVKQGRSRVKRYGCLFTCLTTCAVHIEIAHSLDTDLIINTLTRFISVLWVCRGDKK